MTYTQWDIYSDRKIISLINKSVSISEFRIEYTVYIMGNVTIVPYCWLF